MLSQSIKVKLNTKSFVKSIIISISVSLLLYQTSSLFITYLKYETSVDIEISHSESYNYPSISVCFSNLYYELDARNIMRTNSSFNETIDKKLKETKSKSEFLKKITEDFIEIYQKHFLNITQFSSNYYFLPKIDCFFDYGIDWSDKGHKCEQMNTLVRSRTNSFECLTFFSEIRLNNRTQNDSLDQSLKNGVWSKTNFNNDFKQMVLLNIGEHIYNFETLGKTLMDNFQLFISIHSSNYVPNEYSLWRNQMKASISKGLVYNLFFSKKVMKRLSYPYQTKCIHYEKRWSHELCIYECFKNAFKTNKQCVLNMVPLFHNTTDDNYKMCNFLEEHRSGFVANAVERCQTECLPNCDQVIFDYELVSSLSDGYQYFEKSDNNTVIRIFFKSDDQIIYIYRPRMTLIDFLANLGGLLSLWLGLSFITLYDYLLKFILYVYKYSKKEINRRKSTKAPTVLIGDYHHFVRRNVIIESRINQRSRSS